MGAPFPQLIGSVCISGPFVKAITGAAGLQILGLALQFGLAVLLARTLDKAEYGFYGYLVSMVMVVAIPTYAGLPMLVMRETAGAANPDDWRRLRGLMRSATIFSVTFSGVAAVIWGVWAYLYWMPASPTKFWTMLLGIGLIPILGAAGIRTGALRGFQHPWLAQVPEQLLRPVVQTILLVIVLLGVEQVTAGQAFVTHGLAALTGWLFGAWCLRKVSPSELQAAIPTYDVAGWASSLWPLSLFAGLRMAEAQIAVLLLGALGELPDVATYRVANQMAILVSLGLTAVNFVLAPQITRLHRQSQHTELQRRLTLSARMNVALGLPILLVFIVWGQPLLALVFGQEYRDAYSSLVVLSIAQCVNASMGSVVLVLNMTGHERSTLPGIVLALGLNGGLGLLLIPSFGALGAALATAAALIGWNLLLVGTTYRKTGLNTTLFQI